MSSRRGADIGLTLTSLGYVTPTPASIGACKSTVSAGLPPFSGRSVGDLHRNMTDGNEYVLSGAAGTTVTDAYSRANGAIGTAETGQAYTTITAAPQILGNVVAFGTTGTGGVISVGAGAQEVSADVVFPASGASDTVHLLLRCDATGAGGYDLSLEAARIKIGRGSWAGSALLATINSGQRSVSGRYLFTVDSSTAAPTLRVYLNDVLIGSVQDGSGNNSAYAGFYGIGTVANTVTLDNLRILTPGTLSWAQALTLGSLGYAAPTLTSLGGAKSTVAAGLPSLVGRNQGDLHRNSTDGNEYVLTGAYASSDSDSFNRADGAVGSTPAPNSRAYVADGSGGTRPTISNQTVVQRVNSVRGGHLINIGSAAVGGFVQATVHQGATYNTDLSSATLFLGTGTTPDGPSDNPNGGWLCNINGANSGGAGIMDLVGPDGVIVNSASAAANVITANETATFVLEVSPDGKTGKVYKNGVLIVSRTVAAAATGTYAGFQLAAGSAGATGTSYLDDFSVSVGGTTAWTQTPTLAGLGYVAPTATSLGAAKSTVAAGLPSFAGRSQGDPHLNLTDGKEYILTGAAGTTVTDNFNRPDSTGLGTSSSGQVWGARGGAGPNLSGNRAVAASGGQAWVPIAAGSQTASCTFIAPASGTADTSLMLRLDTSTGTDYEGRFFWTSATFIQAGISRGGTGALVSLGNTTMAYTAGRSYTLTMTAVGQVVTFTITDTVTGASVSVSTTDAGTVLTGANAGFLLGFGSVDDFSAFGNGTFTWTSPTAGGSMNYRAAWSSGVYSVNDVVSSAYGLYVATSPVPAGTAAPELAPIYAATPVTSASTTGTGATPAFNGQSIYQQFTVGGASVAADVIRIAYYQTAGAAAGHFTLGIASAIGASPSAVTFLSNATGSATIPANPSGSAVSGTIDVSLSATVTLSASTSYYLVAVTTDGGAPGANALQYTTSATYTGISGDSGSVGYANGVPTTGWSAPISTYHFLIQFLTGTRTPYWKKIANSGNQENVGQVAAAGATLTIPDPEIQPITRAVLTANLTVALPTVAAGKSFTVVLVQDATGGRTVAWTGGATVLWPGGVAPTQTATALKGDVYSFMSDGAGNWLGFVGGQNY